MATALYRRYRPEAFSEMIGQAHVTEPLMTALRSGRIGHAYLFSGPRGCGKTTSARILARCLNCAEGPTDTPCGVCPSCVELSRDGGGSLDVVEIDAASHGGVDDARELRERAVFAPARDRYKIFIIDEAHMVTSGGFNALLKIVEEPPPHVKFIFATTEPEKVIGTIRSRTHHYPFRLIAPGALMDYVQQLCDTEGVQVEQGVLGLVVRSGGGSVRDTLSILDQLIAGSESGAVSLERATGLLGFTSGEVIDDVVNALGAGDAAAAFRATDRVVQTGQDPRRFVEDLLERLRDLIVISATSIQGASAVFRGVPEDQLDAMFAQSQAFTPAQLSKIADTVSGTLDTMVGATAPRLHLELMVARALISANNASAGQVAVAAPAAPRQSTPAANSFGGTPAAAAPAAPTVEPAAAPVPAQSFAAPAQSNQAAAPATPPQVAPAAPAQTAPPVPNDVIAAMRSARDFLKSDDSGVTRPPMVPLGGHAPAAQASASAPAVASESESQTAEPQAAEPQAAVEKPEPTQAAPTQAALAQPAPATSEHSADASSPETVPSATEAAPIPAQAVSEAGATDEVFEQALENDEPGLEDLLEVWPDLLDELLESNREAWNAVRQVQPLAFEGEILTVGLASKADLDAFKSSGAGPLREALSASLGISVKYVPKPLPEGVRPTFAGRESDEQAAEEPSPSAESIPVAEQTQAVTAEETPAPPAPIENYPEPAYDIPPEPDYEPEPYGETGAVSSAAFKEEPEAAQAVQSAQVAQAATAGAADLSAESTATLAADAAARIAAVAQLPTAPAPGFALPTGFAAQADHAAQSNPAASSGQTSSPETSSDRPVTSATAAAGDAPAKRESPGFTRYGESVVREVLGARFVEERPLPEGLER
ncbi:DNA polymerase III subunit gamma and tau [Leucobacter sp. UT-8R-CII-1-4]|uniref:DNA polymerase III subunit gamma and tau n=1 Tax=Leucobacter sp. UT-8R-CII-1-4 TaxID=3040075 RepID=UPI0024A8220A|nr:DNA polymerase III subunit gamma and tau [Leucobacter sp. UT-8R-CII-1-4]MDI6022532.1 DNA polymerase III subunit gamma and tau [Leucobacter sp. UT-8R-CII-1-4]